MDQLTKDVDELLDLDMDDISAQPRRPKPTERRKPQNGSSDVTQTGAQRSKKNGIICEQTSKSRRKRREKNSEDKDVGNDIEFSDKLPHKSKSLKRTSMTMNSWDDDDGGGILGLGVTTFVDGVTVEQSHLRKSKSRARRRGDQNEEKDEENNRRHRRRKSSRQDIDQAESEAINATEVESNNQNMNNLRKVRDDDRKANNKRQHRRKKKYGEEAVQESLDATIIRGENGLSSDIKPTNNRQKNGSRARRREDVEKQSEKQERRPPKKSSMYGDIEDIDNDDIVDSELANEFPESTVKGRETKKKKVPTATLR